MIRSRFDWLAFLTTGICFSFSFFPTNFASGQTEYGRTAGTGNWNDGQWIDVDGNTSATPGVNAEDDVNIGDSSAVLGSVESASVDVTDSFVLDTINVNDGTLSIASSGSITADSLDLTSSDSTAIINGNFTSNSGGIQSEGGTLTIGGTVANFSTSLDGGVLNLNSGSLSGNLTLNDRLGSAVTVNQTASGTSLDLGRLTIDGTSSLTLNAGDAVNTSINLRSGATLTVNQQQDIFSIVDVADSTLNLNENLTAFALDIDGASTINRGSAGTVTLNQLRLGDEASFVVGEEDVVTESLQASGGSQIISNAQLQLLGFSGVSANSGGSIILNAQTETGQVFAGTDSTVDVNAQTTVLGTGTLAGTVQVLQDATLNINDGLSSDDGTSVIGGTINLNSGGLLTGDLRLSNSSSSGAEFNQNGGSLDLADLSIATTSGVVINSTDSLSGSFRIDDGAELTINRALSLTGESEIGNATLNLNQDLEAEELLISGSSTVNRTNDARLNLGTLSLDQGSFTQNGFDTIRDGVNATNGSQFIIDVESDFTSDVQIAINSELTINANTTARVIDVRDGSTVNVNADTVTTVTSLFDSELNLDANFSASTLSLNAGSVLNQNSGTFTGRLQSREFSLGDAPVINRGADTVLNLTDLGIDGNTNLTIRETDQVTDSIRLTNGADLTLVGETNLTEGVFIDESNINLQSDLFADSLTLNGNASLTRSNGAAFDVQDLNILDTLSGTGAYTVDGTDTIRRAIDVQGDGILNINTSFGDPTRNSIRIVGADLNVNAQTNVSSIALLNSETSINADANTRSFTLDGGTLNLNDGVLTTSIFILDDGANQNFPIINRNGGSLDINELRVSGRTANLGEVSLELLDEDRVNNSIELEDGAEVILSRATELDLLSVGRLSEFTFRLDEGESEGLALRSLLIEDDTFSSGINASEFGLFTIEFGSLGIEGLNYGLRLDGDQTLHLQDLLDEDLLTFDLVGAAADALDAPQIGIIRDTEAFGDFTFLGFTNTVAVPEPSSFTVLFVGGLGFLMRRKRARSQIFCVSDRDLGR